MLIAIPTLQVTEAQKTLAENIENLSKLPTVSKILIVNNSQDKSLEFKNDKVIVFNSPHNLYVNPSWNLGALVAGDDEALMLLNDDIVVNPAAVEAAHDLLQKEDCLIGGGWAGGAHSHFDYPDLTVLNGDMPYGFGCCLALRSKSWPVIPNSMLVYFGDLWILDRFRRAGKNIYTLNAGSFRGGVETTSRLFGGFYGRDAQGFNEAIGQGIPGQ